MSADDTGRKSRSAAKKASGKPAGAKAKTASKRTGKSSPGKKTPQAEPPAEAELEATIGDGEDADLEEDEFASEDGEPEPGGNIAEDDGGLDDFDAELEEGEEDIDAVVAMSAKEQNARSLEVRRAIEERMEKRRLDEDLDYLDLDFD